MKKEGTLSLGSAVSIGIGGMVGGGIFAVLGLAVQLGHGGTPIAFALAGLIAFITSYSYARLSLKYPSQGGTVEFINQGFGTGIFTGGMNILLWISYIVMLSLYAFAFGSYGASFFPASEQFIWKHILLSSAILLFAGLNALGTSFVGKTEEWIVGLKISILLNMDEKFISRSVNEGFSGGEKKRNEIFQMAMLEPSLAILDETDSGLDIDALKIVADGVNKLRTKDNAFIVVTHYQRLLNFIVPDFVHVLYQGKIVESGDKELALHLEEYGYDWVKEEAKEQQAVEE